MCSLLPAAPVSGSVQYLSGDANNVAPFDLGTIAGYDCDYGFVRIGVVNTTCGVGDGVEGVWSGQRPSCEGEFATVIRQRFEIFSLNEYWISKNKLRYSSLNQFEILSSLLCSYHLLVPACHQQWSHQLQLWWRQSICIWSYSHLLLQYWILPPREWNEDVWWRHTHWSLEWNQSSLFR